MLPFLIADYLYYFTNSFFIGGFEQQKFFHVSLKNLSNCVYVYFFLDRLANQLFGCDWFKKDYSEYLLETKEKLMNVKTLVRA